jgi:FkbM family methyltransferase
MEAMRAAAYVSATGLEQRREDLRPAEQRRQLLEHIDARDWTLAGVYEDIGPDARPGRRVGLNTVLGALSDLDRIVVARLDRLGTSGRRIAKLLEQLDHAGVGLVSLAEGFDTGAESGRPVAAIVDFFIRNTAAEPPPSWQVPTGWQAENLRAFGFAPATLIDVGAGDGTRAIYEAFPDSHLVLIEPLVEFERDLEDLVRRRGAEYVATAVGDAVGTATLRVNPGNLFMSSLLQASSLPETGPELRSIPVTTLDALLEERGWKPPFGLKLDAEGFEHRVIAGGRRVLEDTDFVIAEISLSKRFEESCTSKELIGLLGSCGFEVADILHAGPSPLGVHADALFARARSSR